MWEPVGAQDATGDFDSMRHGLCGLVLALGLFVAPACLADGDDGGLRLRFVPDPTLLQSIDPQRLARAAAATAPELRPTAVDTPTAVAVPAQFEPRPIARKLPASWPTTLKEVAARKIAEASPDADHWSPEAIKEARQQCAAILKRIAAVATEEAPIKEGDCGTPAPILLTSVGRNPQVVISPPALVNCEMAEALHTWLKQDLQPLARKHLGGPIVQIMKMSDYSCRNAYGRARGRLSEHGRVNAIDIAGFTTAQGEPTMLISDWGVTAREVRRLVAATRSKAEDSKKRIAVEPQGENSKALQAIAADATARTGAAQPGTSVATGALPTATLGLTSTSNSESAGEVTRASILGGAPRITIAIPGTPTASPEPSTDDSQMSRLGGPKPALAPAADIGKQLFLRGAQETACKIFGTVLGPEANNAHRNHFHLDMAERGSSGTFCQ